MSNQNYLIVENNVVVNVVVFDPDTQEWTPPPGSLMMPQAEMTAMVWVIDVSVTPAVRKLTPVLGAASVGFTWDGSVFMTNEPESLPVEANQPVTTGTTAL